MAKAKSNYDVTYSIGATDETAAGIKTATDNLISPIELIERKWNNLNKALGVGAGILIAREGFRKLNAVAQEFEQFLEQQDRESGFANLAKSVNTNTQRIINDLKEASHETLTYNEILDSASESLFKGLQPDQLPRLMELARASTKITGRDLRGTFDSVTQAVVTHSEKMMRSQGIMIDYDKHLNILAKSLGIKKSELNNAEESQAFYNATLEAGSNLAIKTASNIDSLGDAYKRSKTKIVDALRDAKDMAFELVSDPIVNGLSKVVDWLDKLSHIRPQLLPQFDKTAENLDRLKGLLDRMPQGLDFNFPPEFAGILQRETVIKKWTEEDDKKFFERQEKLVDWTAKASQTEWEFWKKFDEDFAKSQDDRFKSVMDNLDANMAEIEAKLKTEEERIKNTLGYKLGESLGEGFSRGAKSTISNGLYDFITDEFSADSALESALKMGARILSESFAEEFLNMFGVKFSPAKFFLDLFTTAGKAVGTGTISGGGGNAIPDVRGFASASASKSRSPISNTFNYYITDDPTLQKRINESVRKSFRDNNLRQDVKGLS